MKRIRIGKDISMRWEITTDGVAIPLEGRDLTVEIKSPAGIKNNIPYRVDGNTIIMTYYGTEQNRVGEYSVTLWENKGKPGQNVVDVIRAFELVRTSQEENDFVGGDLQIESVDLGTENFDILTEGGYRAINIDTLQAEALDDSVNIKGKTYSNESFTITLPKANLDSAGVMSSDDKQALQEHGNRIAQIITTLDEHTESINAKITTDRIENGAVTTEKIATSAFDNTLSVSGKIAPADVVGEKLNELEEQLNGKESVIEYVDGEYIQNDGTFKAYNSWSRTNFIKLGSEALTYKFDGRPSIYNAWYDQDKKFIKTFAIQNTQTGYPIRPDNAVYVAFSNYSEDLRKLQLFGLPTIKGFVNFTNERIERIEDEIKTINTHDKEIIAIKEKTALIQKNAVGNNLLDLSKITLNKYVEKNGEIKEYDGWFLSSQIEIGENTNYQIIAFIEGGWSRPQSVYYSFYDSSGNFTHGSATSSSNLDISSVAGDKYLLVSMSQLRIAQKAMLTKTSYGIPSGGIEEYEEPVLHGATFDGVDVKELDERVKALEEGGVDKNIPQIILPKYAVAVVGHELNIYTENVVLCDNINNYDWEWDMKPYNGIVYNQYIEGFRLNAASGKEGEYTLKLVCHNKIDGSIIAEKSMTLYVVSDMPITDKKIIFIGDSLTAPAQYIKEIQSNLSNNGLVSIGTLHGEAVGISNYMMEGRGGWSAYDYCHTSSHNGNINAFLNPSTQKFDFSYYMQSNGFSSVDIVALHLGTNANSRNNQGLMQENIKAEVESLKEMITSIHSYNSNIAVCLHIPPMPATQDGWTYSGHGYGAQHFVRYIFSVAKAFIEAFGTMQNNVYLSPTYFNVDRNNDYQTTDVPMSSRNATIIKRQNNNVHPYGIGMLKMADVYWGTIQKALSL